MATRAASPAVKPGRRGLMTGQGENFMQHTAFKPALQAKIGRRVAKRNAGGFFLQLRPDKGSPKGHQLFPCMCLPHGMGVNA